MNIQHDGKRPGIHPSAFVAPNATVCGDVTIGPDCRIMYGACVVAEGGSIELGASVIILENAVIRSTARHSTRIGRHCLVGPGAHLVGCVLEEEVFIATGASVFHGAHIGPRSEVRINGVVHLKTTLPPESTVPIGWVAVGDPVAMLPADQHEKIWEKQKPLNFPLTAYGLDRSEANMVGITEYMTEKLAPHRDDQVVPG